MNGFLDEIVLAPACTSAGRRTIEKLVSDLGLMIPILIEESDNIGEEFVMKEKNCFKCGLYIRK